jgi:predicted methyltransferase
VLHDFAESVQADTVLKKIKTLLKPGGCLAIIEFKKIQGPPGPPLNIRLSEAAVEKMVTPHGFVKKETADMGKHTYLKTFLSV